MIRLHALLVALVVAACRPTAPPDTSAAAKVAIEAANASWSRLTSTGHADSIAEFYHASAVMMPPNMSTVAGKDAIRGFFATLNSFKPNIELHTDSVWGSGNAAVEQGRYRFTFAPGTVPPGAPPVDSGKYVVRWVNENGRWLMMQDIWNSDLPMPMSPAPAPAPTRRN